MSSTPPLRPRTLVVVGQGYVGLPLAVRAVEAGYDVIGVDIDCRKVSSLNAAESFIDDVSDEDLARALATGRYWARCTFDGISAFDVAVVTVPTPLRDGLPDLSFIESAMLSLAPHVRTGSTVVLESTTSPGTTEDVVVPLLEGGSGLSSQTDFYVGFSPERIDPGNPTWNFRTTPKIVSGVDSRSLQVVREFYDELVDTTIPVAGTREAEMAKLLENTFRHVNIALVNELAMAAHELGIDAWETIDAAGTKPFGFMKFLPGPGVGGHCLPVDPTYLSWEVRRRLGRPFRFIELANEINGAMPAEVVRRAERLLNDRRIAVRGARIVLIGLAYKPNSGDLRESPALKVAEILRARGAHVSAVDPHVTDRDWPRGVERVELTCTVASGSELAIVLTPHDVIDLSPLAVCPVLDTRHVVTVESVTTL